MNSFQRKNDPGTSSIIVPPRVPPKKPKKKTLKGKLDRQQVIQVVQNQFIESKDIKWLETLITLQNVPSSGGFVQLTAIPQGPANQQRIADTVWLQRMDLDFTLTTANTDVFNVVRLLYFQWKVDSLLAAPTANDIFTNVTNANVHSFLNFDLRRNYNVIEDNQYNMTGTATNPSSYSQHAGKYSVQLKNRRLDFNVGSLFGTGHTYVCLISDSTVAPYPILTMNVRLWYYDN